MAKNVDVARRGSEAFNKQDSEALAQDLATDFEGTAPGGAKIKGQKEAREYNQNWWNAFPNAKTTTTRYVSEGDVVIEHGVFRGRHTGVLRTPMGDIEPTGKDVEGTYVNILTFREGKVTRQELLFDRMQLMEQIGKVPTAAGAAR
jgi:predicted ester cyclase